MNKDFGTVFNDLVYRTWSTDSYDDWSPPNIWIGDPSNTTITTAPPNNPPKINTFNQGWQCPNCGRIYAPYVSECRYCNSHEITCNGVQY